MSRLSLSPCQLIHIYQFSAPFNSTFEHGPNTGAHHIDPRLVPLPHEDNTSDFEPANIAKLRDLKPAIIVAGAHQKDKKGKKCAHSSDSDSDSDTAPAPKQRGHRKGSSNFAPDNVNMLLVIAENKLPIGCRGWKDLAKVYKAWAKECGWPKHDAASLESKFKQVRVHFHLLSMSPHIFAARQEEAHR
jgi:hypothetical protein